MLRPVWCRHVGWIEVDMFCLVVPCFDSPEPWEKHNIKWNGTCWEQIVLSPPGVAVDSDSLTPPVFLPCRSNFRPGGPAEIQHGLHPVHARSPQHAPDMWVDGQDSRLPSAQPPPQVFAQIHQRASPQPAQTRCPTSSQPRHPRHTPQRRPPVCEAAPAWWAHLPRGWTSGEAGPPQLPPGDAGDVEALVNSWINDFGSLFC